MNVVLATEIGPNCMTEEQGTAVYSRIHPALSEGKSVELDFAGVEVFASPFFNKAIGRLLEDIPPENLNRLLKVEHLVPAGLEVLRRVIENSKEFYHNPQHRIALNSILEDHSHDR